VGGAGFNWVDVRDVVASALVAECRGRKGQHYLLTGKWLSLVDLAALWGRVSGAKIPRLVAPMGLARAAAPFAAGWAKLWGRRPLFTSDRCACCATTATSVTPAPMPNWDTTRDRLRKPCATPTNGSSRPASWHERGEIYGWLLGAWVVVALATVPYLLLRPAPYGRHGRPGWDR